MAAKTTIELPITGHDLRQLRRAQREGPRQDPRRGVGRRQPGDRVGARHLRCVAGQRRRPGAGDQRRRLRRDHRLRDTAHRRHDAAPAAWPAWSGRSGSCRAWSRSASTSPPSRPRSSTSRARRAARRSWRPCAAPATTCPAPRPPGAAAEPRAGTSAEPHGAAETDGAAAAWASAAAAEELEDAQTRGARGRLPQPEAARWRWAPCSR